MKILSFLILSLIFNNSYPQEINCLNFKLYNSQNDVVRIKNQFDIEKQISNLEINNNTLQLIVLNGSIDNEFPRWTNHHINVVNYGYKVLLVNNSSSEFRLPNKYGKIIITRQVFYNNEWKNVQSFNKTKRAYCGNGLYKKVVIKPKDLYTFIAPCLEGDIKTKFRFAIFTISNNKANTIYSNEFDGYINRNLIE